MTVLDIYAASEAPIAGITGQRLPSASRKRRTQATYAGSFAEAAELARGTPKPATWS